MALLGTSGVGQSGITPSKVKRKFCILPILPLKKKQNAAYTALGNISLNEVVSDVESC